MCLENKRVDKGLLIREGFLEGVSQGQILEKTVIADLLKDWKKGEMRQQASGKCSFISCNNAPPCE